ncbi:hypothetical protein [Streptomyces sp. 900105245]|uniref:Uncharacterized protein n=1 Tax=Streptomyces sp. 900105245 TaxID=3154379 RepID=A0ABV1UKF4_9ACTN
MTIAVHRPYIVTARIDTAQPPAPAALALAPAAPGPAASAPAPAVYTVTVYVNTARHSFGGYRPRHPLAEVTHPDGSPLRLTFHASARINDHEAAADAAYCVGNRQGVDDHGQSWPADVRSISTGDVVKVTGPDHWIIHLAVVGCGFSPVPEPTILVPPRRDPPHLPPLTPGATTWPIASHGPALRYCPACGAAFVRPQTRPPFRRRGRRGAPSGLTRRSLSACNPHRPRSRPTGRESSACARRLPTRAPGPTVHIRKQ